jgi:alkanesulfonate monooxygenase SsuD/methylene tetrahydromethanopterin reductase-like flavin-dependent oxidoreductase (luciferase family)
MAQVGVMIEAQEGLTWDRWRCIVRDVERLGFASLRVSDHCQSMAAAENRDSLAAWPALALAAEWTERIQLGPMVCPMTFYVPAVLGRTARAVDELSNGRLIMGVGAGWNEAEHRAFGIPLPGWRERFDRLEEGIRRIRQTFDGRDIPFLVGGGGERRTRDITAREASEWNYLAPDVETFRDKSAALDERCREIGREPSEIRRSLMRGYLLGRDRDELLGRIGRLAGVVPRLRGMEPEVAIESLRERWFIGTPEEVVGQMRRYAEAGVDLFMLQHFLLDDADALALLAGEVVPGLSNVRASPARS